MLKSADSKYNIHKCIADRWSPRAFSGKPVEDEKILRIFEAASWAASSRNEQPWRFILGKKNDKAYSGILDALNEWNQQWAKNAPLLAVSIAKNKFDYKNRPNSTAAYDVGQSMAMLSTQATIEGLFVHQMGGFSPEKIIQQFKIPDDCSPLTAFAIGYLGDPKMLPDELKQSEIQKRTRKPLSEILFSTSFGEPASILLDQENG